MTNKWLVIKNIPNSTKTIWKYYIFQLQNSKRVHGAAIVVCGGAVVAVNALNSKFFKWNSKIVDLAL